MRMTVSLPAVALALLAAVPLAAQGSMGAGMAMDKDKMDHGAMGMKEPAALSVHDGKLMLMISHDFTMRGSPDAIVYLAKDGKVDGTAMELGRLRVTGGDGSFTIRDQKRAMGYNTVVLYSKSQKLAVATAPLAPMAPHDGAMMGHDTGMMKQPSAMGGGGVNR